MTNIKGFISKIMKLVQRTEKTAYGLNEASTSKLRCLTPVGGDHTFLSLDYGSDSIGER